MFFQKAYFIFDPVVLWISLLSGLLGLEAMAVLQLMLSRPLVSGLLVGLVMGDGVTGLSIGCLLEMLWVGMLPVGAFVPPDLQSASIITVAGTLLLVNHPSAPGATISLEASTVFMILVSIPLAVFGGYLEIKLRA